MSSIGKWTMVGGLALAGLFAAWGCSDPTNHVHEIRMLSDLDGADVWFDPVGIWIEPRQTVRWLVVRNVHTATAYHPDNGKPMRIPDRADAWDSGYLTTPGQSFDVRLEREGVYDYFCSPHELAGMVGRIVVGEAPLGPATPLDALPRAVRDALPTVQQIVEEGIVRREFRR